LLLIAVLTYEGKKGDYILNIATTNAKILNFTLDALNTSSFSIYDQNHNLIYTKQAIVHKLEVSKTISLEGHPAGTYVLEVNENGKIIKHEIKIIAKKAKTLRIDESMNENPSLRR